MVELAVQDIPGFALTDIEIRRPGKSYRSTRPLYSARIRAGPMLFFIIGLDAFLDLPSWKDAERLLASCRFVGFLVLPSIWSHGVDPFLSCHSTGHLGRADALQQERTDVILPPGHTITLLRLRPARSPPRTVRQRGARGPTLGKSVARPCRILYTSRGVYTGRNSERL